MDANSDKNKKQGWWLLKPVTLLVCVVLLLLFRLLTVGSAPGARPAESITCGEHATIYTIRLGETCWAISQKHNMSVEELTAMNEGIDCHEICLTYGRG